MRTGDEFITHCFIADLSRELGGDDDGVNGNATLCGFHYRTGLCSNVAYFSIYIL